MQYVSLARLLKDVYTLNKNPLGGLWFSKLREELRRKFSALDSERQEVEAQVALQLDS